MTTKRINKTLTDAILSRPEAEDVMHQICRLTIEGDTLDAKMDAELAAVRERYQGRRELVTVALKPLLERMEQWATNNPGELGTKKSLALTHGTIGFRTGQPQLKTLRGCTWATVLEKLRSGRAQYIRTKEEVNKEALLADREQIGTDALRALGIQVAQEERFFVEPNRTPAEEVAS